MQQFGVTCPKLALVCFCNDLKTCRHQPDLLPNMHIPQEHVLGMAAATHLIFSRCRAWDCNVLDVPVLGLNFLRDVIHNVIVLLSVQQLISSNLRQKGTSVHFASHDGGL